MAVSTDTSEEEVDTACLADLLLICGTLSLNILGIAVEHVYVLCGNVDMVEKVLVHEGPVGLLMVPGKTDIFIHVEGNDVFEGNVSCLVEAD